MTNINTEGLPPEMQARIAEIIEKAKSNAITPGVPRAITTEPSNVLRPEAPIQRPPSLMDHTIALRQEVADMRNEVANMSQQVAAMGQVVEAVGQAVGSLYNMFQAQTEVTDYSRSYEETAPGLTDDY
tara:strand:+ start:718 stop:1101 length:384 start_codon:yes stop_codon:yes gene_type:complete